jgi:TPR repeat protein
MVRSRGEARSSGGYADGKGVKKSRTEAIKWWEAAGRRGYVPSMYLLGQTYANGQEVKRDVVRGATWLSLVATRSKSPELQAKATETVEKLGKEMSKQQLADANKMAQELQAGMR